MLPRRLSGPTNYISSGSMNQYVSILQDNPQRDYEGEVLPPLQMFQSWAEVSVLVGTQLEKAQQVVSQVTHKVVLNYPDIPVESNMYIQLQDGRVFQVMAKQDMDERKVQLVLLCLERNDGLPGEQ